MYYLRSRPAADPIKFTVDVEFLLKEAGQIINHDEDEENNGVRPREKNGKGEFGEVKKKIKPNDEEEKKVCPMRRPGADDDEECLACGS